MNKILFPYLKKYILLIIIDIVLISLQAIIQAAFLMAEMKKIISAGVVNTDMNYIIHSGYKMFLLTLLVGIISVGISYLSAKISARCTSDLREDCFSKIMNFSSIQFEEFNSGSILTRITTDVTQLQYLILNMFRTSLMVFVILICMLILIFMINKTIFSIICSAFLLTVFLLVFLGKRSKEFLNKVQTTVDNYNHLIKEKIYGVITIRAFRNELFEEQRLQKVNESSYLTSLNASKKLCILTPISMLIMNWVIVIIYYVSSVQIKSQITDISNLLLIFQYLTFFIAGLAVIPLWVDMLPKVIVSKNRILEILNIDTNNNKQFNNNIILNSEDITVKNLSFKAKENRKVFNDISFSVSKGENVAIVGGVGSGKTTLLKLLAGDIDTFEGNIEICGHNIKKYSKETLCDLTVFLHQTTYVFNASIRDNITVFKNNISDEKIKNICDIVKFDEVLNNSNKGLDTIISFNGANLSGGQKQRLMLARAITKDAKFYLFDNPFNALDENTELIIMNNIKEFLKDKTIIYTASKISSLKIADKILVIKDSIIKGYGTHNELLNSCNEYIEFYNSQKI